MVSLETVKIILGGTLSTFWFSWSWSLHRGGTRWPLNVLLTQTIIWSKLKASNVWTERGTILNYCPHTSVIKLGWEVFPSKYILASYQIFFFQRKEKTLTTFLSVPWHLPGGNIQTYFLRQEIFMKQYLPGCFGLINILLVFLSSTAAIPLGISHYIIFQP